MTASAIGLRLGEPGSENRCFGSWRPSCAVVVVGTVGYVLIEGWGFLDSLYMTVTTIFTVGFGEVHPLSTARVGVHSGADPRGCGYHTLRSRVHGGVRRGRAALGVFRRRAVKKQVDKLEGHYIICGYGRVGEAVARHFATHKARFVVVDNDPESLARAEGDGFLVVRGRRDHR